MSLASVIINNYLILGFGFYLALIASDPEEFNNPLFDILFSLVYIVFLWPYVYYLIYTGEE